MLKILSDIVDKIELLSNKNTTSNPVPKSETYLEMERSFAELSQKVESKLTDISKDIKNTKL